MSQRACPPTTHLQSHATRLCATCTCGGRRRNRCSPSTSASCFRLEGPQSECRSVTSTWHVAHETMAAAQASASQRGVTLNSFLLGTLAWLLHDASEQRCFAISQTYLGRTMDELRAVGSYSVGVPMVFDFTEEASLDAVPASIRSCSEKSSMLMYSGCRRKYPMSNRNSI